MDEAKDSVTSIQVSDHEILTGSADGYFRRYDLRTGRMHADFIGSKILNHDSASVTSSSIFIVYTALTI